MFNYWTFIRTQFNPPVKKSYREMKNVWTVYIPGSKNTSGANYPSLHRTDRSNEKWGRPEVKRTGMGNMTYNLKSPPVSQDWSILVFDRVVIPDIQPNHTQDIGLQSWDLKTIIFISVLIQNPQVVMHWTYFHLWNKALELSRGRKRWTSDLVSTCCLSKRT